ncbi:MAG: radical SAM protein [Desulfovibrionaceae bacterium]
MKALLVVPSQENVYGIKMSPIYPPLGVLYLAAMLEKHGHEVRFIDMDAEECGPDALLAQVDVFRPGLVGFSCVTPTVTLGFDLAARIKKAHPETAVVMGGIHATIAPDATMAAEGLDAICIGESEHTVVELVDALEGKRPMESVAGIQFKRDGVVVKNEPRPMEKDLDNFPFPAFHLVKDLTKYSPADATSLPVAPIMTSRGCPGACTYCCTKQIFGRRFRGRSVENILEEVDILVNRFGIKELHFLDDNLSTNRKRILALCAELKKRAYPIKYEIANGIRADMVDREILLALRGIGMVNIGFGVESGNEEILKIIRKGIDKDTVRRVMAMAKELGFETWGFFIIGLYGENAQTVQDTIDFAIELDPDFAKFLILKPFPGSQIFDQLNADGLIDSHDYSRYGVYTAPVHHLHDLTADEILNWQKRAFRRFYFRPKKILRHLMRIRSWTQFKIVVKGGILVLSRIFQRKPR